MNIKINNWPFSMNLNTFCEVKIDKQYAKVFLIISFFLCRNTIYFVCMFVTVYRKNVRNINYFSKYKGAQIPRLAAACSPS